MSSEMKAPQSEHRFPCEVCGADLRYNPNQGQLVCDHCGHTEEILQSRQSWQLAELDLRKALESQIEEDAYETIKVTNCNNCGAQIEFRDLDHSKECAYCASPVVIDTGSHRQFKPKGVVPFQINQKQARDILGEWLKRRWFAPSGLSQYARKGKAMQGVYMPFWTFDAQTQTDYRGQRGNVYYITVGSGKNRRRVPKVRWRNAKGRVRRFFDDVLVIASKSLPSRFTNDIKPYDLGDLEPYNPEFLAGFRAEAYSVSLDEGWQQAQFKMQQVITRDVKFDIGGDRQRIHDMRTQMGTLSFKHILLPVYTIAYKFRGKTYRCLINGQTGRISGERPYSIIKIVLFAIMLALLAFGFLYFAESSGAIQINSF